ncbi:EAL domain-containing protein [Rubrivivax sp. A210]|uniref:GGDEF/EAL domain-containing response regulator n=1 Tax=Rubrivivax sp. A210 TaxID=2772301 RepID=UPI0019187288|nr:EAL domain-containing protein [Rubrivivax sp. A210]
MIESEAFDALFAPEPAEAGTSAAAAPAARWKVLLVDDDSDIRAVLHLALRDVVVEGLRLELLDADSATAARAALAAHPDIALLLLDVVMETEDAGLQLVRHVRRVLGNRTLQIILLTGQPGYAPQREVVSQFEIDGYRLKSELTTDKIFVSVYAALRTHQALRDLVARRAELETLARTLREREDRLRSVVESAPDAIVLANQEGIVFGWNEGASQLFGRSEAEMLGQTVACLLPPPQQEAVAAFLRQARAGALAAPMLGRAIELSCLRKDGVELPIELVLGSWTADGERNFSAIVRNISERRRAEANLRLAATVYASSWEGIVITDARRTIIDVNPAFCRITGYAKEEAVGHKPRLLSSGRHGDDFYRRMDASLADFDFWQGEIWNRRRSGEVYAEMLSISVVRDPAGRIQHYIGVFSDISTLKAQEQELYRIAHFDALTGVPNRRLLSDRLAQSIARALRTGKAMAVCYLDLDGFKAVNDSHGHDAGDALLIEIAERLKHVLRADDTLARLGGDEFVVLLTDLAQPSDCNLVLQRMLGEVARPVRIEGTEISLSASIGVTTFPEDDDDAETLLRHADQAMYLAKQAGKNRHRHFDTERDREVRLHQGELQRLREALRDGEFVLHYQPRVDLGHGAVVGVEALIRWEHPERGCLLPGQFLHHLLGSELEVPLGEWVIEAALRQMHAWKRQGLALAVSVNISADHLLQASFAHQLRGLLRRYPELRPQDLELEILESAALTDMKAAVYTLTQCRQLGVQIALDDFGTGYSSLTYFLNLPVQVLKIDQSFVRAMLDDPSALGIVQSVVHLARAFNRTVVAEGVESAELAAVLPALGCQHAQGFEIARPMAAAALPAWMAHWQASQPWRHLERPLPGETLTLAVVARSLRLWVDEMLQQLDAETGDLQPGQDPANAAFARWFSGNGTARYGALPEFKAIARAHEGLQAHAARRSGLGTAVDRAASRQRLLAQRDEILALLQAIQARQAAAADAPAP